MLITKDKYDLPYLIYNLFAIKSNMISKYKKLIFSVNT